MTGSSVFRSRDVRAGTYAGRMGKKNTAPGYWRANGSRLEQVERSPEEPAPPFRLGLGWIVLWLFLLLLGGFMVYVAVNSYVTGEPLMRRGRETSPLFPLILGGFVFLVPFWHLPQIRREWGRLYPSITATQSRVELYGDADHYFLPWEIIRGFRVESRRGKDMLLADLVPSGPEPEPGSPGTVDAWTVTDIRCWEPFGTAYVLNYLLGNPALRRELGSPRSEADVNAVLARALPWQGQRS